MKYLIIAICLGGMLLFAFSFNRAWRPWTVGIVVIGGVLFLAVTGAILVTPSPPSFYLVRR